MWHHFDKCQFLAPVIDTIALPLFLSLPRHLKEYNKDYNIESLGAVVIACPYKVEQLLLDGVLNNIAFGCINVTNMIINVSCVK